MLKENVGWLEPDDLAIIEGCKLIFRTRGKDFRGRSAVEVVRALERDDSRYRDSGAAIRKYLIWSLDQLGGTISPRDLAISDRLDDETLALGFLVLLDECGIGQMLPCQLHTN